MGQEPLQTDQSSTGFPQGEGAGGQAGSSLMECRVTGVRQGPEMCDSHLGSGNTTKWLEMSSGSNTYQGGSSSKANGPNKIGPQDRQHVASAGTEFSGQLEPRQL